MKNPFKPTIPQIQVAGTIRRSPTSPSPQSAHRASAPPAAVAAAERGTGRPSGHEEQGSPGQLGSMTKRGLERKKQRNCVLGADVDRMISLV